MRLISETSAANGDRFAIFFLALAAIMLTAMFDLSNRNTQLRQMLDNQCQPQRPGQILDKSILKKTA